VLKFGYFIGTPCHLQAYPFIIIQVGSSPNIVTWSGNRFLCSLALHLLLRLVSRLGLHLGRHLISHHVTHNHLRRLLPPERPATPHSAKLSPQGTDSLFMPRQNPVNNPRRIYQYVTGWRDRYAR